MRTTGVSKCLDKKLIMFGFEVFDILAIFLTLSVLNFIFGQSSMKWLFVWIPTLMVSLILKFSKRGKPDKYLVHWLRFQVKPGVLSAFHEPTQVVSCPTLKRKV